MILLISIHSIDVSAQHITTQFNLPDSVRAVQYLAAFNIKSVPAKASVGIKTDVVSMVFGVDNGKRKITLAFPEGAKVMAAGKKVSQQTNSLKWDYPSKTDQAFKLLIAVATDSAENFSLYTGYTWLPTENKWKLIGTCRIEGRWTAIKEPAVFQLKGRKKTFSAYNPAAWIQRSNGSWKNMLQGVASPPQVIVTNHVDSLEQVTTEQLTIQNAIKDGKSEPLTEIDGIYYSILKEGTGRNVLVSDTVVAHYKGYLFSDGSVFDQTKENPATFPLRRLIRGWQIGVPLCKVGGKIKLVIPSGLAYSIRTRAAKIPPNSILVFEIEVVSVK